MGDTLSSEEIRKMVNNTADLQQKAAEALSSIANRQMKVFDPRNEADITSEDGAIVWSSKSIELAYDALKKGFGLRKSPFYRGNVDLRKANLTFQYTEEEIAEIIRCKKDIVYFANTYIYLKTPEGRRKIKLRPYQVKLLKTIQDNKYVINLSSRQVGKCLDFSPKVKILNKTGQIEEICIGDLYYRYAENLTIRERIVRFLWKLYSKL